MPLSKVLVEPTRARRTRWRIKTSTANEQLEAEKQRNRAGVAGVAGGALDTLNQALRLAFCTSTAAGVAITSKAGLLH